MVLLSLIGSAEGLIRRLQHAVQALRTQGHLVDAVLLPYLSPLGWEHINLTGDHSWRTKRDIGKFQPLRPLPRR